jgi:hypothetical protein
MPVQSCSFEGKPGYKFGESGKCYTYTPGDNESRVSAKSKAAAQERAAYAGGWKEKFETPLNLLKDFADFEMNSYEEFIEKDLPPLPEAEQLFADTLVFIASKYGKLEDGDKNGIWVGYESPEENEDKDIGVKCSNCYFYESENVCSIIKQSIHPEGMCRLAAIPPGLVDTDGIEDDEDESDDLIRVTYGRPGANDPRKTPAPAKDRRSGSRTNRSGSAESGSSVTFSEEITNSLKTKMEEHNKKNSESSKKATLAALKAVYRRGAGAFSTSHRPGMTRGQWAMARVNAYLFLLRNGRPSNPNYTTDNDLLPKSHPRSSK